MKSLESLFSFLLTVTDGNIIWQTRYSYLHMFVALQS